ncbi:MAG: TRAP transporter large permease subunit [Burkholderiaceae bacterium]|jgi:tripartite ATP-independent transporter DctM subunit|nr:TRAP transporter large permease subunit [Burkholderiaceae bacterium]
MSPNMILLLMFGGLTVFMLTGLPIAFVLGGLSLLFTVTLWEPNAVIVIVLQIYDTMKSEALLAIPLFILMACILQRSGVIEDLYKAMELWFGRLRGGLAIGTVIICVMMAAMTGVVGAAVTAMGILALPEMLRRGYKPELALGTICASGTLGILIPPSVLTIVYAVTAQISIGQMLIAGIVPGILLASLYIGYIVVMGWLKPEWVPIDRSMRSASWGEKLLSLRTLVFPILLIVLILGSIFFGIATPTESAAVGVGGALLPALFKRSVNLGMLRAVGAETLKASAMILWITLGAKAYVAIFTGLGGADTLLQFIQGLEVNRWLILGAMMLLLIFLGTVLDELGIILLTVPVFLPIVRLLGFDELWFGVLYAITIQMGYISPPFGYTLFYIKGTLPKNIGMSAVYRGILPFVGLQVVGLLICAAFPDLVTYLPRLMAAR